MGAMTLTMVVVAVSFAGLFDALELLQAIDKLHLERSWYLCL
jgi:hypothetical protein